MIRLFNSNLQAHRVKQLLIRARSFLDLLRGMDGSTLVKWEGIPPDASVLGFSFDEATNVLSVYVESSTFDEVEEGHRVPESNPTFTAYYPEIVEPDKLLFTVGEQIVRRYVESIEQQFIKVTAFKSEPDRVDGI